MPTGLTAAPENVAIDTLEQGLILIVENRYCPSRDWQGLVAGLGRGGPGLLEETFGIFHPRALVPYVADMHLRVLDGIRLRLARGALGREQFAGRYVLSVALRELSVRRAATAAGERYGVATLTTEAEFVDASRGKVLRRTRLRAVASSQERAVTLGDLVESTVDDLYGLLVQALAPGAGAP